MSNDDKMNGCSGSCQEGGAITAGANGAASLAKKLRDITKEDAVKSYEDLKK